jgi:hypothetical protein
MPVDVGRGNEPNHVVFDNKYPLVYTKSGNLTDLSKSRHYGYRQNPAFYYEGELHKNIKVKRSNGKTQTFSELYDEKKIFRKWKNNMTEKVKLISGKSKKAFQNFMKRKQNKVKFFECNKSEPAAAQPTLDKGTWNVIITEKYTGSKCTHIERTAVRNNCRRGKLKCMIITKKLSNFSMTVYWKELQVKII